MNVVSADVTVEDIAGGVKILGVSGDLRLTGISQRVDVAVVSGEVVLENASGRIRVKTVSGEIVAENAEGEMSYQSVSGGIEISGEAMDELTVKSVSGDIDVRAGTIGKLTGRAVSGDVSVSGALAPGGMIEHDNVSGSIRLRLQGDINARFKLLTGAGGSIRNRLSDDRATESRRGQAEKLRFTVGGGDAIIALSTGSGDITVRPAD